MTISTAIFDFGNVINIWEPEKAVAALFADEIEAKATLESSDFVQWVGSVMDAGADVAASLEQLKEADPDKYALFKHYVDNIDLAHATPVPGTEEIIRGLADADIRILGMTNCGVNAFDALSKSFNVIELMDDVFVSALEKRCKPEPEAYHTLLDENGLAPFECVFVDDKSANVDAARSLGMDGIQFISATDLRDQLNARGLLQ